MQHAKVLTEFLCGGREFLMFGPTDPQIWAPANPEVRVVRDASRRMDALAVDLVMQIIGDALASGG